MIRLENVDLSFRMHYHSTGGLWTWIETLRHVARGEKLHRYYALRQVSFEVPQGEILGVVGPNGAGKSTLLRVIAGIYPPDSGDIVTEGKISSLLALGTGFNNSLSGADNVRLAGLLAGVPKSKIPEMIDEVIDFAELNKFRDVAAQYYSSGMYAKLAFGVVLYLQPEILLIDEIFSVGDQAFQEKAQKAMRELRERAKAQVIVSHDMALIESECTLALYLDKGAVTEMGLPKDIVRRYRNMR
ncbi:MAG: ABC transporter ATP-binding protein [Hyphomicrobiales bacterium]